VATQPVNIGAILALLAELFADDEHMRPLYAEWGVTGLEHDPDFPDDLIIRIDDQPRIVLRASEL
jgi:hypothetical protein